MTIPAFCSFRSSAIVAACWICQSLRLAFAQADPSNEDIKSARDTYKADEWPKGEVRVGFPLGALELKGWKGEQLRSDSGHMSRKFTAAGAEGSSKAILIEAFVGDTTEKGQQQLLTWLLGRQSPVPAPRIEERNLKMAGVGFLGLAGVKGDKIASIYFVDGNITVRVSNTNLRTHPDVDLGAIATTLDELILTQPRTESPPRPTIERLTAKPEANLGEVVPLDVAVKDAGQGTPHFQWIVGGPGQGYVEAKDGKWFLHTTKAGQISLVLELTGSNGTFVKKEIKVNVRPARR